MALLGRGQEGAMTQEDLYSCRTCCLQPRTLPGRPQLHPPTHPHSLLYRINWHRAPPSITPGRGPPSRVGVGFLSKQGKVFHEAVAPYRLAFSSLTQGPAPVPAQAGGARARSPRCPGSAARKGPGRGASARTWLQPPARTPRRRALLAEGPSAALGRPAAKQR
ncbi:hypothetical protein ACRRTK_003880 [Alexandromys fortis]